jgi:hypothetical protein
VNFPQTTGKLPSYHQSPNQHSDHLTAPNLNLLREAPVSERHLAFYTSSVAGHDSGHVMKLFRTHFLLSKIKELEKNDLRVLLPLKFYFKC